MLVALARVSLLLALMIYTATLVFSAHAALAGNTAIWVLSLVVSIAATFLFVKVNVWHDDILRKRDDARGTER